MLRSLVVVALMLIGQIGGAQSRYDDRPTIGQAAATGITPITPLNNQTSPAANGSSRNPAASPSGSPYNPSRPSGFSGQPMNPAFNSGSSQAAGSRSQSQPPPGYQVQPSFQGDSLTVGQQAPSQASLMMKEMLTPRSDSQLRGEPVRLVDVISSGRTRNEQTQRVEAYWDLCSSVADYYLGLRELDELRKAATSAPQPGSAALQEFEKAMTVRSDTSLRAARASQFRLAGFIGRGASNLPLPADMPHCGSYTSHYEQIFSGRSSAEAQGLAQLIPLRYAELNDAAIEVTRAEEWLARVASGNQNSDAAGNLQALKLLALQRRAFVQIARDYNRRIARYSELATPGQISPDKLTGMLIMRPVSTTRSAAPAQTPSRSNGADASPPRTFADAADWLPAEKTSNSGAEKRDSAVQPASATQFENNRERSLLVKPRQ